MSIAEKLVQLKTDFDNVYSAGVLAEAHRISLRRYINTQSGNDTTAITANIPFKPDVITVICFSPLVLSRAKAFCSFTYDLRSFGQLAATATVSTGSTLKLSMFTHSSAQSKCVFADNGDVTISKIGSSSEIAVFASDMQYVIIAEKYTDKSDAELISDFVNALPDTGGAVTISKIKVESAFTSAEWNALIAKKPNRTFSLV